MVKETWQCPSRPSVRFSSRRLEPSPVSSDISNTPTRKVDSAAIQVTLRTLYIHSMSVPLPFPRPSVSEFSSRLQESRTEIAVCLRRYAIVAVVIEAVIPTLFLAQKGFSIFFFPILNQNPKI